MWDKTKTLTPQLSEDITHWQSSDILRLINRVSISTTLLLSGNVFALFIFTLGFDHGFVCENFLNLGDIIWGNFETKGLNLVMFKVNVYRNIVIF